MKRDPTLPLPPGILFTSCRLLITVTSLLLRTVGGKLFYDNLLWSKLIPNTSTKYFLFPLIPKPLNDLWLSWIWCPTNALNRPAPRKKPQWQMSGFGIFFSFRSRSKKIEVATLWKLFPLRGISDLWKLWCFVHSEDRKSIHSSHGSKHH